MVIPFRQVLFMSVERIARINRFYRATALIENFLGNGTRVILPHPPIIIGSLHRIPCDNKIVILSLTHICTLLLYEP